MRGAVLGVLCAALLMGGQPWVDGTHRSRVLGDVRQFRLFLPPAYDESSKRYPVMYYFHGHSDRYTLEHYDKGTDTVPRIAAFVAGHDVIVVAVDGYVPSDYTGFYGGSPWDIRRGGGQLDFGEYFLELSGYIDAHYRTLTGRRYRATSGLSMGGFMSLYLSARYPDRIGSASAFNPGPEFYVGEPGRRSLWRPKDHVGNHEHSMVRLVRASGDYISQYHEETRAAYASSAVGFEYRQDEYHRHWATSIGETFDFHMRAFGNPSLDTRPDEWSYTSAHKAFNVWGYDVGGECSAPALISLERVTQGSLQVGVRRWAPDGPPGGCAALEVRTAALYTPGARYTVADLDVGSSKVATTELEADPDGRLRFRTAGGIHEVSFAGPGTGAESPLVLPFIDRGTWRVRPGAAMPIPLRLYNPRTTARTPVTVEVSSTWPTVEIVAGRVRVPAMLPHGVVDLSKDLRVRFTAGEGGFARASLQVQVTYDEWHSVSRKVDVLIAPASLPPPLEVKILDGRAVTFPVFLQHGNQGGGKSVERTVTEGKGNGNGRLEVGEQATIWVKLGQGIDPFDKNNWRRAKVYAGSEWIREVDDIQEEKGREWTGAQNRTSLVEVEEGALAGAAVPLILDCESYSFQSAPDVRFGRERLYQPFQVHKHHLFEWVWQGR